MRRSVLIPRLSEAAHWLSASHRVQVEAQLACSGRARAYGRLGAVPPPPLRPAAAAAGAPGVTPASGGERSPRPGSGGGGATYKRGGYDYGGREFGYDKNYSPYGDAGPDIRKEYTGRWSGEECSGSTD